MTETSTLVLEARTTCSSCAAVNPTGSLFCWQCYKRFPGAVTPPAEWARPDATGESDVSVVSGAVTTSNRKVLRIALVVVVAVAGFLAWRFLTANPFPGSFRTFDRLDSPSATQFEDAVTEVGDLLGIEMHGAIYGHGSEPAIMAILSDREIAPAELGSRFVEAPAPRPRDVIQVERDGALFVCFPADADVPGAACTWTDDDTVGVVYGRFMRVRQQLDLSAELRAAIT